MEAPRVRCAEVPVISKWRSFSQFHHLPDDLVRAIFNSWLNNLFSISRLDVAYCNGRLRQSFLEQVSGIAVTTAVSTSIKCATHLPFLVQWLERRGLHLDSLHATLYKSGYEVLGIPAENISVVAPRLGEQVRHFSFRMFYSQTLPGMEESIRPLLLHMGHLEHLEVLLGTSLSGEPLLCRPIFIHSETVRRVTTNWLPRSTGVRERFQFTRLQSLRVNFDQSSECDALVCLLSCLPVLRTLSIMVTAVIKDEPPPDRTEWRMDAEFPLIRKLRMVDCRIDVSAHRPASIAKWAAYLLDRCTGVTTLGLRCPFNELFSVDSDFLFTQLFTTRLSALQKLDVDFGSHMLRAVCKNSHAEFGECMNEAFTSTETELYLQKVKDMLQKTSNSVQIIANPKLLRFP